MRRLPCLMRLRISSAAAAPVLLAPAAIAFASGGYFDEARLWAAAAAWLLVAVLAVMPGVSLDPGSPPARLALAGLAALTSGPACRSCGRRWPARPSTASSARCSTSAR